MSTTSLITLRTAQRNRARTARSTTEACTRRHGLAPTVSATSFDVDGAVRAMVRPSVPNYRLRRLLVGTAAVVALAFSLTAAIGVIAGFSGSAASAAPVAERPAAAVATHVARPGDTMWSIANTYRGDIDRDRYINTLIDLNGGVEVIAGAAIVLP